MVWIASCTAILEGYNCMCRACDNIRNGIIPDDYYRLGEINDDWVKLEEEDIIDEKMF